MFALPIMQLKDKWILTSDPTKNYSFFKKKQNSCVLDQSAESTHLKSTQIPDLTEGIQQECAARSKKKGSILLWKQLVRLVYKTYLEGQTGLE